MTGNTQLHGKFCFCSLVLVLLFLGLVLELLHTYLQTKLSFASSVFVAALLLNFVPFCCLLLLVVACCCLLMWLVSREDFALFKAILVNQRLAFSPHSHQGLYTRACKQEGPEMHPLRLHGCACRRQCQQPVA